jgi:hypothetical protein
MPYTSDLCIENQTATLGPPANRVQAMGIEEIVTAPRSPSQNRLDPPRMFG